MENTWLLRCRDTVCVFFHKVRWGYDLTDRMKVHQFLLFFIFETFLPKDMYVASSNPCIRPGSTGLKTWGERCQNPCGCKNNTSCDSSGFCPDGCKPGWSQAATNRSCSSNVSGSKLRARNASFRIDLHKLRFLRELRRSSYSEKRTKRKRTSGKTVILYRFLPSENCVVDSTGGFTKSWQAAANPPIVIKTMKVSFEVEPRSTDVVTCYFKMKQFPKFSVMKYLRKNEEDQMFHVQSFKFAIADTLSIHVKSTKESGSSCTLATIAGFSVYGLPICSYRKWGLHCTNDCYCRCNIRECHPVTGNCFHRGFSCPARKFGPSCSSDCSPKCYGSSRECHILSGSCKECEEENLFGRSCESVLTPAEVTSRRLGCENISQWHDPSFSVSLNLSSDVDMAAYSAGVSKLGKRETVGIITIVIIGSFIFICLIYIYAVRQCAKKGIRAQIQNLNTEHRQRMSMMTYTEFSKEFMVSVSV